jgi:pimeloyl-ACP methyl ester carboxylesterase
LIELPDALRIRKIQLVAFSMAGGVVLSLADMAPDRVASVLMLSANGVQEQELLGDFVFGMRRLRHARLDAVRQEMGRLEQTPAVDTPRVGLQRREVAVIAEARR